MKQVYTTILWSVGKPTRMVMAYKVNDTMVVWKNSDEVEYKRPWVVSHKSGYAIAYTETRARAKKIAELITPLANWDFCTKLDKLMDQDFSEVHAIIRNM